MNRYSFLQILKLASIILLISGLFWFYFAQQPLDNQDHTVTEHHENASSTSNTNSKDRTVNVADQEPTPFDNSIGQTRPDVSNETFFENQPGSHQILTEQDLQGLDLGGIDHIPTEEEKQELMKYAPETSSNLFQEDIPAPESIETDIQPPETSDPLISGPGPGGL